MRIRTGSYIMGCWAKRKQLGEPMYYQVVSQCTQSLRNLETCLDKAMGGSGKGNNGFGNGGGDGSPNGKFEDNDR
jgi:hypothetical protein